MKIGFYAQGDGPHLEMAKYCVESAKDHMPFVKVYHLTDGVTPDVKGSIPIRIPQRLPMGVRRLSHYAGLEGEWCFVDSDVIFQEDVSSVFEKPFDVALASREGTYMEGTDYAEHQPYNFGVVFSKNPKYWRAILPLLMEMPLEKQHWGGEQELCNELALQALSTFSVEILPSRYNFTPKRRDTDVSDKAIVHYKGQRKAWITTPQPAR